MELTIKGAGGGGGGSSFTTRPDTLRSNDTFEGLLGLCSGPIKGPVNGLKSIRVDGTPIEDASGNTNFPDFTALLANGDPLQFPQKVSLRLGAAGAPQNVNVQLRNVGGNNSVWVTRTITDTNAESIDLRFIVNQLYKQDKSGLYGTSAHVEVQMKPVGSATWINPIATNGNTTPAYDPGGYEVNSLGGILRLFITAIAYDTMVTNQTATNGTSMAITGKTTSPYVKEMRVKVPNTGAYANVGWDVRCRLVENESLDADPNFEKRTIAWESLTAVFSNTLGDHEDWRGVAWLQLYGKASDSFAGIPEIDGIYDTKIVSVPPSSVYDAEARTYTGAIWDGSWAKSYTNDPAWLINDVISDPLAGIAHLVPNAHLNKWDALELSKYCSEMVSDGAGGTHPRFSLNYAITEAQRSDDFVRYLAGSCGATAWDNGDGDWRAICDKPRQPAALFTIENIEGEFNYSHTDVDTRFNDVTVVFSNEEFDYRQDNVRLTDEAHIATFGRKPTKMVAVGCTNRQQAVRWAILKLRTNINEFRQVSFTTNRQGKLLERFSWILVADSSLNQTADDLKRTTGRVVQNNGGSIVLRDTIRLETGVSYTLEVTAPNPAYDPDTLVQPTDPNWQQPTITYSRNVTNTAAQSGDVREIFLDQPLPADVAENANIALSALGLPSFPKVYRVLDVEHNDDGEHTTINAIEVDTGKYVAADTATYDFHQPGYDGMGAYVATPLAPGGGVFTVDTVVTPEAITRVLNVNWLRPPEGHLANYRVDRRLNGGAWMPAGVTNELSLEIINPEAGDHEVNIYAVDQKGRVSMPLNATFTIDALTQFAPVALLTNESMSVAAASDGSGFDLSDAGGQFILYTPGGALGTGVTYSVLSEANATATIGTDGVYTITDLTADNGSVTFRAEWGGFTIDRIYNISKARAGGSGSNGLNVARVFLYQRADAAPDVPSTTSTFTFATTTLTGFNNGWATTPPAANGKPLWVTVATASSAGLTDTIATGEWTAPVTFTQDGINTATVTLYQRSNTVPPVPSATCTYTFATGALTGITNGWTTSIPPANGYALYAITATALGTGATDTIATGEWAAPAVIGIDTSDDTLTVAEKQNALVKFAADLEARYNDLISRATVLGLSTTSLTTARTNWLNLLGSYSPAWNEVTKDTVIYSHLFADKNFPTGWTAGFTTVATTLGYTTVSDSDTTNRGNLNRNKSQAAAATQYSSGWVIKKKTAAQTVFPRLILIGSGGTSKTASLNFDAFAGVVGGVQNLDAYGVLDLGTDWLVWLTFTTDATNTFVNSRIEPAFNATLTATGGDSTLTNSVDILGYPLMTLGGATKLGHFYLTGILNAYSAKLAAMARSVSEMDATLAYSLTGPASQDFSYSYDGATANYTTVNVTANLKDNGGTKISTGLTWKYAVITGTVNGNAGDGGVAEYAMTVDGGDAYIPVSSLGSNTNKVEIRAYKGTIVWHCTTVLNKKFADPPEPTGSSGSGGPLPATVRPSASLSNAAYPSLAMAYAGPVINGTMPTGKTTAVVSLNLNLTDVANLKNGQGTVNVELQRMIGSTWTAIGVDQVGSAGRSNYESVDGSIIYSFSDTGLTAGANYQWRMVAWHPTTNQDIYLDGTMTVSAP